MPFDGGDMQQQIRAGLVRLLTRAEHRALLVLVDLMDDRGRVTGGLARIAGALDVSRSEACRAVMGLRRHTPPLVKMVRRGANGRDVAYFVQTDCVFPQRNRCENCKQACRTGRHCATCKQALGRRDRAWHEEALRLRLEEGKGPLAITTALIAQGHSVTMWGRGAHGVPGEHGEEGVVEYLVAEGAMPRVWLDRRREALSGGQDDS